MALINVPIYPTRNLATTVDDEARRIVSGNGVTVIVNPDGSISLDISGALGPYVLKAGDTMTGPLVNTVGAIPNSSSARSLSFYSDNAAGSSAIFFYRGTASPQGGLEFRTSTGTAYGNLAMRINPNTTIETFQKNIIDNGATGISGGHLSLRNTTTYQLDIGIGTSGPTDPDAFLVNRHASGSISFFTGNPGVRRGIVNSAGAWTFTGDVTVDASTSTSNDFSVLQPGTSPASSFVSISSPNSNPGILAQYSSTKRRDIRFTNTGIELGASTNTAAPGAQVFLAESGTLGVVWTATTPLVFSSWAGNAAYSCLRTNGMSGQEYMILANDAGVPDTFVSCKTGGDVYIRANANGNPGQLQVTTSGAVVNGTVVDQYSDLRQVPLVSMTANLNAQTIHSGRHVVKTVNSALSFILQPNATVAVAVGTIITVTNDGSTTSNITVTRGAGVELWRNGTNANVTLTPGQSITVTKIATNRWQA